MPHRLALTALLAAALGAGLAAFPDDDFFAIRKNFTLFARLYETLAAEYVDPLDAERFMRTGIAAMTGALDPYTVFLDEAAGADIRLQQQRQVGTTGLVLEVRGGRLVVTAVLEGSPAEAQGVRPGDAVVTLAGQDAAALSAEAARALLRGEPGSAVRLDVEREGAPGVLAFTLVRAGEPPREVTFAGFAGDPAARVGYVRLEQFAPEATQQVAEAVQRLAGEAGPGGLAGLVLDLRGNPGGLLDQAVTLTGLFVPRGTTVVTTRGRAAGTGSVYRTPEAPAFPDVPLAVLLDERSASASEIVAGALQDLDRAVVLGAPSFGKGLVQVVRPLPYGTALKLTVSRYYLPSGRSIQSVTYRQGERPVATPAASGEAFRTAAGRAVTGGAGIVPDVAVGPGQPSELEEALTRAAAFLRFANRYAAAQPTLPDGFAVDDALYADFRRFVEAEGIVYTTAAERAAEMLAEELRAAGYDGAAAEQTALARAIAREKARDFERHAPRLRARLAQEIRSRYVGQAALTRAALGDDAALARA
ncbi:MAG: S41 family peptidase, partial [Rubricoccaceae bacterium]